jgi:hypothetical protein
MTVRRSSVYLSGWEYNRLLQEDPSQPRISALPAAILWNGSHQLWMFETIYCTRESFENEIEATDRLGWVNGLVLRDLYDQGVFHTVDWAALPVETKDKLRSSRTSALTVLTEQSVRDAIVTGDAATLELAKTMVLQPVLDHYGCFESGAPNSVSNWFKSSTTGHGQELGLQTAARQQLAREKLDNLANLMISGLDLCRAPGTGVSQKDRDYQSHVQDTVEKPMIPALLAGEGDFTGAQGFLPYIRELERVKDAYQATNEQLRADWEGNKSSLFRLRDAASKYLWNDLHGYWLPRLLSQDEEDREAGSEFDRWVRSTLRIRAMARFLHNWPTNLLVGAFGPPALTAALAHAGVPMPDAMVSGGLAGVAAMAAKRHLDQVARLAIFSKRRVRLPLERTVTI